MTRERAPITGAYRIVVRLTAPLMLRWGRLHVEGLEVLPPSGPTILVADHDSYWDPIAIAVAARNRRQVRALAKSTLWRNPLVARLMDGMGHIPVIRGASNEEALARGITELRAGSCIGMFPEGTRSLGGRLRARSGVGRLAEAVPSATVVCVRVTGTTDVVRFPRRPAISVAFYHPRGGGPQSGESAAEFSARLLDELREVAPPEIPGRRRTAAKFRARLEPPA